MEESVANRLEKLSSLESEVSALKAVLHTKEEDIVSLQARVTQLDTQVQQVRDTEWHVEC